MPLSPLFARAALATVLAIGAGVALNVLHLQDRGDETSAGALPAKIGPALDTERLRRLTLEAGGPQPVAPAAPAPQAAPASATGKAGRPARAGAVEPSPHRVGSFAPTSGTLALAALPGADPAEARRATIRSIQQELGRRGYEPGPADGAPGLVTRAAVMAYEHDQGLPITADPSPEVLAHLRHGTSAPGAAIGLNGEARSGGGDAEGVIRQVQQALGKLGYFASEPDGQPSEETLRAIREFEMDHGLVPTGRISGPLVARLARQAAAEARR